MVSIQTAHVSNTTQLTNQEASCTLPPQVTGFRPLSLASNIDLKDCVSPLDTHHSQALTQLTGDTAHSITSLRDALKSTADTETQASTITEDHLRDVLETPITLKLLLLPEQKRKYPDGISHQTDVMTLVDFFNAEHIEVTGSSARHIIEGKPQLQNQDLDLVLSIDLDKFGKEPEERNTNIRKAFAEHFNFPADVADRCSLPFINHSFGCTFKPTIDTQKSRSIDITFIHKSNNIQSPQNTSIARWDNIQSSPRVLFYKDQPAKVTNLLGIKALQFLQKNSLVILNPDLKKDGALTRATKAVEKQQEANKATQNTLVKGVQPGLVQDYYKETKDTYAHFKFNQALLPPKEKTKQLKPKDFVQDIPFITMHELLDVHSKLADAYNSGELNYHDVKAVEICLAEAAYRHIGKSQTTDSAEHLLYRAHILQTAEKAQVAANNRGKAIEHLQTQKMLHPLLHQQLLDAIQSNSIHYTGAKTHFNTITYTLMHAPQYQSIAFNNLKAHLETLKLESKNKPKQLKQELKSLITKHPEKLRLLQEWLVHFPEDEAAKQDFANSIAQLATTNPTEAVKAINTLNMSYVSLLPAAQKLLKAMSNPEIALKLNDTKVRELFQATVNLAKSEQDKTSSCTIILELLRKNTALTKKLASHDLEAILKLSTQQPRQIMLLTSTAEAYSHEGHLKNALALLTEAFQQTPLDHALLEKIVSIAKTENPKLGLSMLIEFCKNTTPEQRMHPRNRELFIELLNSKLQATPEVEDMAKQLNFMVNAQDLLQPENKQAATNTLKIYLPFIQNAGHAISQQFLFRLNAELKTLNDSLHSGDEHHHNDQIIKRSAAQSFKIEADRRLMNSNSTTSELNQQINQMVYQQAIKAFQELDTHTAQDKTHMGEIQSMIGAYEDARQSFKDAMALDNHNISRQLSFTLLKIKDPDIFRQEINNLTKLIIMNNIQKKPITLTLPLELMVALQHYPSRTVTAEERLSTAQKIIGHTLKNTFTENTNKDFITPSHILSKSEAMEIDALSWAARPPRQNIEEQVKKGHPSYEFMQHHFDVNRLLNIEAKVKHLHSQAKSNGTLDAYELKNNTTLLKLIYSQITSLTALDFKNIIATEAKGQLINQQNAIANTAIQTVMSLPIELMQLDDKVHASMLQALFRKHQFATLINDMEANTHNTTQLMEGLIQSLEELPLYNLTIPKKATFKQKLELLELEFGDSAPFLLSAEANNLVMLGLLTQGRWDAKAFGSLPDSINEQSFMKHRSIARELFKTNADKDNTISKAILRHFNAYQRAYMTSSDAGKLVTAYHEQLSAPTATVKYMNTIELSKYATQAIKASSTPKDPIILEAAQYLKKK